MNRLANKIGGNFGKDTDLTHLSPNATKLVNDMFQGLTPVYDTHTHIIGTGTNDSGCWVNPSMTSWRHPVMKMKYKVIKSACTIDDNDTTDEQYVQRLVTLIREIRKVWPTAWAKHFILGFDHFHDEQGNTRVEKSGMYIPNDYIFELCNRFPDCFLPCPSIHPYRVDAVAELQRCYDRGARMIKWLPNSMGMDPASPLCDPFYDKMKDLGLVLLSHTGKEHSVDAGGMDQQLGNPLKLIRALDHGVKVIAAHCAGEGCDHDNEEHPEAHGGFLNKLKGLVGKAQTHETDSYKLFFRMMDNPKYEGLLFGDISATTLFKRVGPSLDTILDKPNIHNRLTNGSDWPLPAVSVLIQTSKLHKMGYVDKEEMKILNEIYEYNQLLFDFVVKRIIRTKDGGKYSNGVFEWNALLGLPK